MRAGFGWKPGVVGAVRLDADTKDVAGCTFRTGKPLIVDDVYHSPDFRYPEVLREHGIISVLNVPVPVEGSILGVLEVDSDEARRFTDDDVNFLQGFAQFLGAAIEHRRLAAIQAGHAVQSQVIAAEREVLFRELHHRVANQFQVIMGLLEVESRKPHGPAACTAFERATDRVASLALAHEQLSAGKINDDVDLAGYLHSLCNSIPLPETIRLRRSVGDAIVPSRVAVRVGLIVNELITNSIKHAFGPNGGSVTVAFRPDHGRREAVLTVSDDGRGMQEARRGSAGLRLLDELVRQIGGRWGANEVEPSGTIVRVEFGLAQSPHAGGEPP